MTEQTYNTIRIFNRVERAAADVRRGCPVVFKQQEHLYACVSVEALDEVLLNTLKNVEGQAWKLLLSSARASFVSEKTEAAAFLDIESLSLQEIHGLSGLSEPVQHQAEKTQAEGFEALFQLAQTAEIIPAFLVVKTPSTAFLDIFSPVEVSEEDIAFYEREKEADLEIVTEAPLVLEDAAKAKIIGFRPSYGGKEHYAIVVGAPDLNNSPLVRIHSACYTGDLLASLRCDCRDQLHEAIHFMAENGGGVVLYLMQEGRGIGLVNKLRAYDLQARGLDTVEANEYLGFADDARPFKAASSMLKKLNISSVRLLTNNPRKVKGLEEERIKVTERVDHVMQAHEHNDQYLQTKFSRLGHIKKNNE